MSIPAPLPSAATSAHPFYLTIALQGRLDGVTRDASGGSTPLGPTRSAHAATGFAAFDVFDEIDSAASPWTIENPPGAALGDTSSGRVVEGTPASDSTKATMTTTTSASCAPIDRANAAVFDCALADTHMLLYGHSGGGGGDLEGVEGGVSEWMKETSGRVTSMAVGHLRAADGDDDAAGLPGAAGGRRRKRRRRPSLRLAVGCEDGNVWVFAPPPTQALQGETGPPRRPSGTLASQDSDAASLLGSAAPAPPSLAVSLPIDAPGGSSRRTSASDLALDSLSPTTKQSSFDPLRTLRTHRSSGSIATLASLTPAGGTGRSKRVVSASSAGLREPSHSSVSLQTYDFAPGTHPRPRKASATVSISTSPAEPSTACHSRARTPAPLGTAADADDESGLPPFQTSSSPPSSPPISPTSMSSIPSVMIFPTSSPSNESAEAVRSLRAHRRSGSRAKDSIAVGIGLWESDFGTAAAPNSGDAISRDESETSGSTSSTRRASVDDETTPPESLTDGKKLEPVLQVMARGFGAVVELRVVDDLRSADPEEGIALVILRASGSVDVLKIKLVISASF